MDEACQSDRPKVMFLVSHSSAGGAQELWSNLAEAFAARGYDVSLVALYPLREGVALAPDHLPWRYVVGKRPEGLFSLIAMVWAMVRLLRHKSPMTVVSALPAANIMAALCAWVSWRGVRVVFTHHSPVGTHNAWLNALDGFVGYLPNVKAVVSVSQTVSASLNGKVPKYKAKRVTIANALPPRVEGLLRRLSNNGAPRITAQTRTVATTGRLAAQKNYPQLIRAAALLPNVQFKIVGDGLDRAELITLQNAVGAASNVQFLGYMPREQTLSELSKADLFVQVSLYEGHSLALIEAAKLGLPLIVSNVPSQVEAVTACDLTMCARIVPLDDEQELANVIRDTLDDPLEYGRLSALAYRLGEESHFSKMVAYYEELVR